MHQPKEPNRDDCCNSGCNPCIFDVYEKHLKLFQMSKSGENAINSPEINAMSQLEYRSFHVLKNIDVCQQHRLIFFKQVHENCDKHVFWNPGQHFLVKYSNATKSCTRAYTPIKLEDQEKNYDFAIIVKRYCNGLVSNYLSDLNIGELTIWRGPYGQYQLNSERFCRIIMIAQGTGIAPLFSILKHALSDEDNMTKIILLYCSKCLETVVLRDELYTLKSYWNFEYMIYLSKKSDKTLFKYKEPVSTSKLTLKDVIVLKPFKENDQFLLCGSNDFVRQYNEFLQEEQVDKENIVTF